METLTVRDFIDIIKEGDPVENHNRLEKKINELSEPDKRVLIIKMTYVLEALIGRK